MTVAKGLPEKAEVVIIGGGIIGSSIAYQLGKKGCTNVVLLEKDTIASAASSKAAGTVIHLGLHEQHFQIMSRRLPELDQGMSTLLADLAERGLLERTIVWWGGEFGRTPRVQWEPPWNGGRGHYGRCFSAVVAGGGFAGGRVVGSSDARGEMVASRPVHPSDLLASILTLLGIDPAAPLPNPRGLDVPIMPLAGGGGGPLTEIT